MNLKDLTKCNNNFERQICIIEMVMNNPLKCKRVEQFLSDPLRNTFKNVS